MKISSKDKTQDLKVTYAMHYVNNEQMIL